MITAIPQDLCNGERAIVQIALITRQAFAFVCGRSHGPLANQMMIDA
jgi:hypothetical protein